MFRGFLWAAVKTLWPSRLAPLYETWYGSGAIPAGRLAAAFLGTALTASAAAFFRRAPRLAAMWGTQVLFLLPTSGIFQCGPQDTADRYTYLACLPWAWAFGWAAARAGRRGTPLLAGILLALAASGFRQQSFWRTPVSFWERVVAVSPESPMGQTRLGESLGREGRWEESLDHFQRALVLAPSSAGANAGAGVVLRRLGRPAEAEPFLRRALAIDPSLGWVRRELSAAGAKP
jgi:tetratricopeptide (TPR) repeat protein